MKKQEGEASETYRIGSEQSTYLASGTTGGKNSSCHDGEWTIDTAAADHLIKNTSRLKHLTETDVEIGLATHGEVAQCNDTGEVSVNVDNGVGRTSSLKLTKVLAVPGLRANLLSAHRLANEGIQLPAQHTG